MASQIEESALENAQAAAHNGAGFRGDMLLKNLAWILGALVLLGSLTFTASAAFAASAPTNGRKVYEWVDEKGLKHYGDHIPPEYAAQEQHVINAQGIEVDRLEAQKTPEQLALADQLKLDEEQRASSDKNLLNTYVSVQEIEHLRDQRLTLLTDQIKVTGQFLEILNGKLKKLSASSMRFKPYSADPNAPPMSDQTADDLVRVGNDIRTQEENLREKRSEEAAMRKQFENDLARFKELKGIH
jgi:hypothetical protein